NARRAGTERVLSAASRLGVGADPRVQIWRRRTWTAEAVRAANASEAPETDARASGAALLAVERRTKSRRTPAPSRTRLPCTRLPAPNRRASAAPSAGEESPSGFEWASRVWASTTRMAARP